MFCDPRQPVISAEELSGLDETEMLEGYRDGLEGFREPGDNRSRSYWHGWRNGAVDGGHRQKDIFQVLLARDVISSGYLRPRH